jgi:type II secretory pathway component PulF
MFLPLLATFFSWSASNTAELLGNTKDFLGDMTPLLLIIIPVFVGIIIVGALVGMMRR